MRRRVLSPTRVYEVSHPLFNDMGVHLYVKRDDLIHPWISGNKWRKLKYHISHFQESGYKCMITYGGAFSNHIYAFAHACRIYRIKGVVIVRGEVDTDNPTIKSVIDCGLDVHYMSRTEYKKKDQSQEIQKIIGEYENPMIVPEGGSSELARKGIHELGEEIVKDDKNFDVIAIAAGTGCTSGCLIDKLGQRQKVEVYSALKGDFMVDEVKDWAGRKGNWEVIQDTQFGGYGKVNHELVDFINDFQRLTKIPLDPIYNGKLVYGIVCRMLQGYYARGTSILWIHSGGLQGVDGFNYRWRNKYSLDPI